MARTRAVPRVNRSGRGSVIPAMVNQSKARMGVR